MKAALDVHYGQDLAYAACVVFEGWQDREPLELVRVTVPAALPYRPGRFYERELPCLLAVLEKSGREFEAIIIDGYVHLRPGAGKGLGTHLHEALPYPAIVIGVAKSPLRIADRFVPVCRGRCGKPLYVSAIGCTAGQAAERIAGMHGKSRIPTLLRLADRFARDQSGHRAGFYS